MSCGSDGAGAGTGDVGEPREDASGGLVVDTALEPSTAAAGEPVAVTCVLEDDGLPVEGTTWDVLVEGTAAYTFDGADLVITEAGDFTVACVETSRDLADGSPASLTVTAGPAASVETEVSTHEAVVGEEVTVTCIVLDEFGNLSDQHVLIGVSPPEVGTLSGDAFTSEVAGSFEIACGDADGEPVDKTPETVVFLAGPLKHVLTTLADEAIPAGTFTEVTCSATDGFGNPVEEDGFEVEHDEELFLNDSDPSEIGGVKAGVWEVTCVLADGGEATLHPADLEITALDPAGLQLLLTPAKPVYQVGDQVTVGFTLVDKYDNPVPGGEIDDPTYDPPDTLLELTSPKVFVFLAEGMVLVSSCVQDAPEWCDSVEAWCDGTAPLLSLTWPERGATLTGDAEVMVTGTVHEEVSSLASFTINGVDVVPAEDGSFSFPMDSAHGLNVIDAAAADVFGNASTAKRSYLFSKQYIPMDFAAPLASLVDEGVLLRLDDSLFAGEPGDPNNLTAILQSLLTEMDLNALIPSPVAEDQDLSVLCLWDTFDIYIDGITYGPPTVSLASAVGGIQLTLDLPDFHANFSVETDGFGCMDYVGTIHANVHFEALIVLAVTPDGLLDILVEDPVATFEDLNVDLTGVSGFLLNWLIDWVTGPLTAIMETLVMTQIQDLIGGLVDSLNETLAEPIQLPIDGFFEGMEQVVLNILLRFDHSKFLPEGGELGLDLAIFSEKKIDRDPLGAMARAACNQPTPEVFQFDEDAQVELAAYLDVVNEALFALWWNGMLNLHLTAEALAGLGVDVSEYGVVGLILDTQALLPPVITSCNPEGQLKAQVGDLYAEASFTMMGIPADIHMYLYLVLGADFAVVDGEEGKEIGITVHDPDKVLVDIAYVNDEWKGKEWMLTSLITDTLVPLLMESLQEEPLSFAIPPISLGDLGGGEPGEEPAIPLPAKDLILDLESIVMQGGYLHAKTGFQLVDTPPPTE